MKDKRLIHNLKMKKQSALLKVIDLYGGYTYTIVRNILGDLMQQEDIDEVVSDVFFKIWNNAHKLDDTKPLKPYLVSIARNEAKNKLRKNHFVVSIDDETNDIVVQEQISNHLEEDLLLKEQMEIINDILNECSEIDKEIFVRFYYNYEKIKEISHLCNVSESKVKMTLSRLRKKMAKALEENGYER